MKTVWIGSGQKRGWNQPEYVLLRVSILAISTVFVFVISSYRAQAQGLSAPTISPSTGSYTTQQTVTMSASTGTIYYSINGTVPSVASQQYTSPITISSPTQINAVAYSSGSYSTVTTAYLDVDPGLAPILQITPILRLRSTFGVVTGVGSPALVTQWTDLSGAGNNATSASGSQPTMASRNNSDQVVKFNGSSQYLSLPAGFANFTSGGSFFLVVSPISPSSGARFFDLGNGTASNNIYMSEPSASAADVHVYNGSTGSSVSSSSAITPGQFQLIECQYERTSVSIYTNGVQEAQSTSMQIANDITRSNNFIGQASGGGTYYSGNIAEVLFYNDELSTSERIAAEAYLTQKYQLLSVTPDPPIISVTGGTLSGPTEVSISSQPGTITFITVDGTTPTNTSPVYNGCPINIAYSQTLKAISYRNGVPSSVATAAYTLNSTQWPAPSSGDMTVPTINLQLPVQSQ